MRWLNWHAWRNSGSYERVTLRRWLGRQWPGDLWVIQDGRMCCWNGEQWIRLR